MWRRMRKESGKSKGNIMDFMTAGITVIAMAVVVMAAFYSMGLMLMKLDVSQVARKYILVMETKGCLTNEDRAQLLDELSDLGLKEIELVGTTQNPVSYGDTILLKIRAKFSGFWVAENVWNEGFGKREYYVEEVRMSTAKN